MIKHWRLAFTRRWNKTIVTTLGYWLCGKKTNRIFLLTKKRIGYTVGNSIYQHLTHIVETFCNCKNPTSNFWLLLQEGQAYWTTRWGPGCHSSTTTTTHFPPNNNTRMTTTCSAPLAPTPQASVGGRRAQPWSALSTDRKRWAFHFKPLLTISWE